MSAGTAPTVLLVEDEVSIRRALRPAIASQSWTLLEAETLGAAVAVAASHLPDAIVLDLGLPDGDGLELIRRVRTWSEAPILVLSARDQTRDKIHALDLGADDYLTKPFSVPELLARVRVALRRFRAGAATHDAPAWSVGELHIDLARHEVRLAGVPLRLTPIEFRILAEIARHPGKVVTHGHLLRAVWGPHRDEPHVVRVHVANLRRKLEPSPSRPRYLLTEPGVGYRIADGPGLDAPERG